MNQLRKGQFLLFWLVASGLIALFLATVVQIFQMNEYVFSWQLRNDTDARPQELKAIYNEIVPEWQKEIEHKVADEVVKIDVKLPPLPSNLNIKKIFFERTAEDILSLRMLVFFGISDESRRAIDIFVKNEFSSVLDNFLKRLDEEQVKNASSESSRTPECRQNDGGAISTLITERPATEINIAIESSQVRVRGLGVSFLKIFAISVWLSFLLSSYVSFRLSVK